MKKYPVQFIIFTPARSEAGEKLHKELIKTIPKWQRYLSEQYPALDDHFAINFHLLSIKQKPNDTKRNDQTVSLCKKSEGTSIVVHVNVNKSKKTLDDLLTRTQSYNTIVFNGDKKNDSVSYPNSFSISYNPEGAGLEVSLQALMEFNPKSVVLSMEAGDTEVEAKISERLKLKGIEFNSYATPSYSDEDRNTEATNNQLDNYVKTIQDSDFYILHNRRNNYYIQTELQKIYPKSSFFWLANQGNTRLDKKYPLNYFAWYNSGLYKRDSQFHSMAKLLGTIESHHLYKLDMIHLVYKVLNQIKDQKPSYENILAGVRSIDGQQAVFHGLSDNFWFNQNQQHENIALYMRKKLKDGQDYFLPYQYLLDADNTVTARIPVVFVYADVLAVEEVDIEKGTFACQFYLDLRSKENIEIDDIEIINLDPMADQFEAREMLSKEEDNYFIKRYRINTILKFEPKLLKFPFDEQTITIDVTSRNPYRKPFMIVVAPQNKQDKDFECKGWAITDHFQGRKTDFWQLPMNLKFDLTTIIRYGYSYGWLLKRNSSDNLLKTLIPISILIIMSYFPVFSTKENLLEMTGILITSLLASIALYFSVEKPKSNEITILDKIYLTSYLMIGGLMITTLAAIPFSEEIYKYSMLAWAFLYPLLGVFSFYRIKKLFKRI